MDGHSIVWLGIGVVAFYYWLRAVDFFPNRRADEGYVAPQGNAGYRNNW
jgi:hypothetical protein